MRPRRGDLTILKTLSGIVFLRQNGRTSNMHVRHHEPLVVLRCWEDDAEVLTPRCETGWVNVHRLEVLQFVAASSETQKGVDQ